jgi:hypothetical protein
MIYLGWIVEEHPNLCDRLIRFGEPLPDGGGIPFISIVDGVTEAINACFHLRRDLL